MLSNGHHQQCRHTKDACHAYSTRDVRNPKSRESLYRLHGDATMRANQARYHRGCNQMATRYEHMVQVILGTRNPVCLLFGIQKTRTSLGAFADVSLVQLPAMANRLSYDHWRRRISNMNTALVNFSARKSNIMTALACLAMNGLRLASAILHSSRRNFVF